MICDEIRGESVILISCVIPMCEHVLLFRCVSVIVCLNDCVIYIMIVLYPTKCVVPD